MAFYSILIHYIFILSISPFGRIQYLSVSYYHSTFKNNFAYFLFSHPANMTIILIISILIEILKDKMCNTFNY